MRSTIEMASGATVTKTGHFVFTLTELKTFEALVRADERAKLHPKTIKAVREDDYCQGDERYYSNE